MAALPQLGSGRGRRSARAIAALVLLACLPARAAQFERLDVSEDSGTYRIEASLLFDAPPEAVVGALLDFQGQNAISPPIREIRALGRTPDGGTLVRIVSEFCIGPFCRDVTQVQVVRQVSPNTVRATAIPGAGDVASGTTEVEVFADGARTRVRMDCSIRPVRKPPFFLPSRWVFNSIRRQAHQSATGLEALARKLAARASSSSELERR